MSTLRELVSSLGRDTVKVRGKVVEIRALSDFETGVLLRHFPVPLAPRTLKDPNGGSLAPKVGDTSDPEYVRAMNEWNRLMMQMEVAVACGLITVDVGMEGLTQGAAEVSRLLSGQELARVFVAVRNLADASDEQRVRDALIVDMREVKADDLADVAKLPEEYGTTLAYLDLRVCERFGLPPWAEIEPGWKAVLRAHERIRMAEEARAVTE